MADRIRLGFVGAGMMGQQAHLANYIDLPDCEVVALAEGRPRLAEAVARRYDVPAVYATHREMLDREDLDAVVAVLWFQLHHALVPELLRAGKHVLTEKAIAVRPETGHRLADLAEERGLVYHVGYMKRSDPASRRVRELVQAWKGSGEMGALRFVRVSVPAGDWILGIEPCLRTDEALPSYAGQEPETAPDWMDEETARHHWGFVNFYIHQVNLTRFLIAEDYHLEYVDHAGRLIVARTDSGATVTFELAPYGVRDDWEEHYLLGFDQGCVQLSLPAPMARQRSGRLRLYRVHAEGAPTEQEIILPPAWGFGEQAKLFLEAVRTGHCISPAREAARDLEIAEEFQRLRTGSR